LPITTDAAKPITFILFAMPRPVTVFTGQWADLPLEMLAPLV
jgi:hypothetical protein